MLLREYVYLKYVIKILRNDLQTKYFQFDINIGYTGYENVIYFADYAHIW